MNAYEDKTRELFKIIDSDDLANKLATKLTGDDVRQLVAEVVEVMGGRHRRACQHILQNYRTQRDRLAKFEELAKDPTP